MRKLTPLIGMVTACVLGCAGPHVETKAWHRSPDASPMSSTLYRQVDWSLIQKLHAGMSVAEVTGILGELQTYNHPTNAIVFSTHDGRLYEVALKIAADGKTVEDISFKPKP